MLLSTFPEHVNVAGFQRAAMRNATMHSFVTFGMEAVDQRIGGGLIRQSVHEFYAVTSNDASAAAGFAVMIAMRACLGGHPLIWLRHDFGVRSVGRLHAMGLNEIGFNPDNLVLVETADTLSLLRAAADTIKCSRIGAVIIELYGRSSYFDLTASRRLAMAAASSGVFTLLLRIDAKPMPSAAHTRWTVAAAPSAALEADAPGHPAFDIMLLRHRGGFAGFNARLEWNRDERCFAPLSGGVPAVSFIGTDQARKAA